MVSHLTLDQADVGSSPTPRAMPRVKDHGLGFYPEPSGFESWAGLHAAAAPPG